MWIGLKRAQCTTTPDKLVCTDRGNDGRSWSHEAVVDHGQYGGEITILRSDKKHSENTQKWRDQ